MTNEANLMGMAQQIMGAQGGDSDQFMQLISAAESQLTGGGQNVDLNGLNNRAFQYMPQQLKQLVTDRFDGKPSELSNWLGNLGLSGMEIMNRNNPGAAKFQDALLASGTVASENSWMTFFGRDSIASGMLDLRDDPVKLGMIQRSIAAQGGQGLAAFTAAMGMSHSDQNRIWEALEADPANAGQTLLSLVPENQRDADVARLSVAQTNAITTNQVNSTTAKLDSLRGDLAGDGQDALDTLIDDHNLAMALSVLPPAEQDRLFNYWKQDERLLTVLQNNLEANPSYLSFQMSRLQADPSNAMSILATEPDQAQGEAMLASFGGGAGGVGGLANMLSGLTGSANIPDALRPFLASGEHLAASVGTWPTMLQAFYNGFSQGGTANYSAFDRGIDNASLARMEYGQEEWPIPAGMTAEQIDGLINRAHAAMPPMEPGPSVTQPAAQPVAGAPARPGLTITDGPLLTLPSQS